MGKSEEEMAAHFILHYPISITPLKKSNLEEVVTVKGTKTK
jgi:hypothetical protein